MATTPTQTYSLLNTPFSATTDFTVLADHCERFADTLIESDAPALKLALCGRLAACLALLKSTLNAPVPPHLIESLTVDSVPATRSYFEPDTESLCDYCITLAQLVTQRSLSLEEERTLIGLLAELIWLFCAELKAPRWVRTENGVESIGINSRESRLPR
ncbi:hypothetical protein [Candidatus Symbiopectobacterium sp. NZEC135]|uniref:hypothetical protein n=1 Tax=Candidatus Symbiopectobacterium sp. NZEC135 TaxID=2820471 RepID=UPI0022273E72|nr:hypothetical protein [Candidatus Symbiopectobacterium sp. NZEC135]MCW2481335.1 hypothetical protein [Candidatus Symbiopectobacterium sp. NZEC135]